jgi:diguanylate cyclase (GGDEF)-like protein
METPKQTVLIVDDTPGNIKLLSAVLGHEQELLFATSSREALEIAWAQAPDLILLDVMMPEMDGYEVCARLKAEPRTRSTPVIFVTAMSGDEDEAKGLEVGAIDYIAKPFSPPIVRARVRNHLELKRYRDFLVNLSATDGLTGIPNRRQFDEFLEREWRRAVRNQTPLSLIMMDIDFFKGYNDHYGHLAGDDCLRQVAQALATGARRPADLVARYGGEEFVCVLPETEAGGALQVAHQLWDKVNGLHLPHARSAVADHITLSLGVATMTPGVNQLPAEIIEWADAQLYVAKHRGRNQVIGEE